MTLPTPAPAKTQPLRLLFPPLLAGSILIVGCKKETVDIDILAGPTVTFLTNTSVTISWETDVAGNSIVNYGTDQALDSSVVDLEERQLHSLTLTGLDTNTTYYYQVITELKDYDARVTSPVDSFTTGRDAIAIVIGPTVEIVDPTTVVVTWSTDAPASSVVEYGLTPQFGFVASDPTYTLEHTVTLSDLVPDTLYYYRVMSASDSLGAMVTSSPDTFRTKVAAVTITVPPRVEFLSPTEVSIAWETDVPGNSVVEYGISTALGLTVIDSSQTVTHTVTLTDLAVNTRYYYRVRTESAQTGGVAVSSVDSFTTVTGTINLLTAPWVEVLSSTAVTVNWETDVVGTSVVDYGTTTGLDSTVADTTPVTVHSVPLRGLDPGIWYYYRVTSVAYQGQGQVSSAIDSFQTPLLFRSSFRRDPQLPIPRSLGR
jgi:phosphodiesterase/alkaline phosphatase D-like protein